MVDFVLAIAARFADGGARNAAKRLALTCLCLIALAAPARAAETADDADLRKAEAAATEAKVFFKAGLFDKASGKFMEAYAISKRPSLMYNAARAYEEALNFREAVALLKHYRDLPTVGEDGRRDADERIARMEGVLRQQADAVALKEQADRQEAARIALEVQKKQDAARAEQLRLDQERLAQLPTEPTPTATLPKSRHVPWALLASAVGVGLLAGGAYAEARLEAGQARAMTIVDSADVDTYLSHVSDAKTFQAVAIAGAVLGTGLATWAAIDWWTSGGSPQEKSQPKSSLGVSPAPGGGMLSWRGAF